MLKKSLVTLANTNIFPASLKGKTVRSSGKIARMATLLTTHSVSEKGGRGRVGVKSKNRPWEPTILIPPPPHASVKLVL